MASLFSDARFLCFLTPTYATARRRILCSFRCQNGTAKMETIGSFAIDFDFGIVGRFLGDLKVDGT